MGHELVTLHIMWLIHAEHVLMTCGVAYMVTRDFAVLATVNWFLGSKMFHFHVCFYLQAATSANNYKTACILTKNTVLKLQKLFVRTFENIILQQ